LWLPSAARMAMWLGMKIPLLGGVLHLAAAEI
jgi:hypothetical protein